jgi:hypothetical protein
MIGVYLAEYFLASVKIKSPVRKTPKNASRAAESLNRGKGFGIRSPYPTVVNVTVL